MSTKQETPEQILARAFDTAREVGTASGRAEERSAILTLLASEADRLARAGKVADALALTDFYALLTKRVARAA